MPVRAVATPGHTDHHLSYVVSDGERHEPAVFTGGSLLYGSVGRTDLVDPARTERADPRAVPLRAPAGATAARETPGLPDARVRQLLLRGIGQPAATTARSATRSARNDALTEPDERRVRRSG